MQWLRTNIYYLTVSLGQDSGQGLPKISDQGLNQVKIKVSVWAVISQRGSNQHSLLNFLVVSLSHFLIVTGWRSLLSY